MAPEKLPAAGEGWSEEPYILSLTNNGCKAGATCSRGPVVFLLTRKVLVERQVRGVRPRHLKQSGSWHHAGFHS